MDTQTAVELTNFVANGGPGNVLLALGLSIFQVGVGILCGIQIERHRIKKG